MFRITCPYCNGRLRVSEEYIGRTGRCSHCRQAIIIPQPADDPALVVRGLKAEDSLTAEMAAPSAVPEVTGTTGLKALWSDRSTYGTAVNMMVAGGIGVVATLAIYLAVLPLMGDCYCARLFLQSGLVGVAISLLTLWSIGALGLKLVHIRRQFAAFGIDCLPIDIGLHVNAQNVDEFIDGIDKKDEAIRNTFLVHRIRHALEHFKSRGEPQEVYNFVNSQSDIDRGSVSSSYSMIKVFIWAIPILGFIGTVAGIGQSVAQFHTGLGTATDLEAVRGSLGNVVSGLTFAFNTTLLGLSASLLVMFPTTALQRIENRILYSVEAYCNEKVLRRLQEEDEEQVDAAKAPPLPDAMHQQFAEAATMAAENFGQQGEKLGAALTQINDRQIQRMVKMQHEIAAQHRETAARLAEVEARLASASGQLTQGLEQQAQTVQEGFARACGDLHAVIERTQTDVGGAYGKLQGDYAAATEKLAETATQVGERLTTLQQGLGDYVNVLEQLALGQSELVGLLSDGQSGGQVLSQLQQTLAKLHERMEQMNEPLQRRATLFSWFRRV